MSLLQKLHPRKKVGLGASSSSSSSSPEALDSSAASRSLVDNNNNKDDRSSSSSSLPSFIIPVSIYDSFSGDILTVEVFSGGSVEDIKLRLFALTGVEPFRQNLMLDNQELPSSLPLRQTPLFTSTRPSVSPTSSSTSSFVSSFRSLKSSSSSTKGTSSSSSSILLVLKRLPSVESRCFSSSSSSSSSSVDNSRASAVAANAAAAATSGNGESQMTSSFRRHSSSSSIRSESLPCRNNSNNRSSTTTHYNNTCTVDSSMSPKTPQRYEISASFEDSIRTLIDAGIAPEDIFGELEDSAGEGGRSCVNNNTNSFNDRNSGTKLPQRHVRSGQVIVDLPSRSSSSSSSSFSRGNSYSRSSSNWFRSRGLMFTETAISLSEEEKRKRDIQMNYLAALELNPEAFCKVVMLFVDVEVNGVPFKAFVDSGAQMTIVTERAAMRAKIDHLIDQRFHGLALGVGAAPIIGRIHMAEITFRGHSFYSNSCDDTDGGGEGGKAEGRDFSNKQKNGRGGGGRIDMMDGGKIQLLCSFTVMRDQDVDIIFGLDMLMKHECVIDLKNHVLLIGNTVVPFLAEKDLTR